MKRTNRRLRALLVATVAIGLVVPTGAHRADAAVGRGAFEATVITDALSSSWSTRGTVSLTRLSVGRYRIDARNITGAGQAQLSMWDTGTMPPMCTVSSISRQATRTRVYVRCWDSLTAAPADAAFTLRYSSIRLSEFTAKYLSLATSSTGSSTPSNQTRWGGGTGRATVTRVSVGKYRVRIPNQTFEPNLGVVMTSATGTAPRWCNPVMWGPDGVGGTDVYVECFRPGGIRANSTFSLTITNETLSGDTGTVGGAAWSNWAMRGDALTGLGGLYTFNSESGAVQHQNLAPGLSQVRFESVWASGFASASAHVTAYGAHRCALSSVSSSASGTAVVVSCRDQTGAPVVASYDVFAEWLVPVVL